VPSATVHESRVIGRVSSGGRIWGNSPKPKPERLPTSVTCEQISIPTSHFLCATQRPSALCCEANNNMANVKVGMSKKMLTLVFGYTACGLASLLTIPTRTLAASLDAVVITATRIAEPVDQIPAAISVVSGEELMYRGATDMATALSLVPGVEAPAGGDAGPSSAVPSFWGLHEFDAFLLVVDDVPWGGAFNPAITTLDFTDIERVEVLKGAAPVMYGATSFVGVVHAIHYPAGEAANEIDLAYGSYGSVHASASSVLPQVGSYRQSVAIDAQNLGFADTREVVANEGFLYRGALDLGSGTLRIDADLTFVRDIPPSPVLRSGASLSVLTPINANFNPADARIDENKYHLAVGYSQPTTWGSWDTLVSYAYSAITDVRAFLHPDFSGTADTQSQNRHIDDAYFDSHLTHTLFGETKLIVGADLLYGLGRQTTMNGNDAYTVPLDGTVLPPPAASIAVNEIGRLDDRRLFAGQYVQSDWKPDDRWDAIAGIRLNEAYEHKNSSDLTRSPPELSSELVSKTIIRPTETIGVSYRLWAAGKDETLVYADYRNAFKPAAIDFGPDYTPELLSPETAKSYEVGLKGAAVAGRLTYQTELFWLDFKNLVVATSSAALANAAAERLKGIEAEVRFEVTPQLALVANASYHGARFRQYLFFDGVSIVDIAGRQLPLSPHVLASAGILYTPQHGFSATAVARYMGRRFLDEENTAPVGAYATLDANIGYAWGPYRLTLEGTNLTNQRPPVTSSEFGSQSFYLLPARMLWLRVGYALSPGCRGTWCSYRDDISNEL
jgi:iron complex outermembrane receptor protein